MAVAYQSSAIGTWDTGTTLVVAKPSGLAVGDLMIGWHVVGSGYGSASAPSGFSGIGDQLDGALNLLTILTYKIADSSDVAASNFTFSTTNSAKQNAALIRISGHTPLVTTYQYGEGATSNTASPAITAGVTPDSRGNSLLLMFLTSSTATSGNSSYAIVTSNPTWTEFIDSDDASNNHMAAAWASRPETTATGNISAVGGGGTTDWAGQLLAIPPKIEFSVAESVTLTETVKMSPSIKVAESVALTESVDMDTARQWTNTSKNNASWVNTDKS